MEPIYDYLISVNLQFIFVSIAGVMVGTMFVFELFYYLFIEKTKLILYLSAYFLFVLLGLISNSFLILSQMGEYNYLSQHTLYEIDSLFDYFVVYSIFLVALYFLQRKVNFIRLLYFLMIPFFNYLAGIIDYHWIFFFTYLYIVMATCIVLVIIDMINISIIKNIPSLCAFLSIIVYFTLSYSYDINGVPFSTIEWLFVIFVVIATIFYFMLRYSQIQKEKELLYSRLTHDHLTGLYSKSYFLEVLNKTENGILVFIDINQFKWINDEKGHMVGDDILRSFADKLAFIRSKDIVVSRFGGDEFSLLLTNISVENSQIITTNLMNDFKETLKDADIYINHHVGISAGIATFSNFRGKEALSCADMAMYESKSNGNYKLSIHLEEGGTL